MYPFIWSKGGGSQESVMVVEFTEMTEKLLGGAVGAVKNDKMFRTLCMLIMHVYVFHFAHSHLVR